MKSWPLDDDPRDPFGTPPLCEVPGLWHDRRTQPRLPAFVPTVDDVVRIATDQAPALGNDAPPAVLGPWWMVAERAALAAAVAHMAFVPAMKYDKSPFEVWARAGHKRPPLDQRNAVRAVAWAPLSLWQRDGDTLRDVVGLAPQWVPDGPVVMQPLVRLGGSGWIAARAVKGLDGWHAFAPIEVPGTPDPRAWRDRLFAHHRQTEPRCTVEDALRRYGHVLVRLACEAAWARTASGPGSF